MNAIQLAQHHPRPAAEQTSASGPEAPVSLATPWTGLGELTPLATAQEKGRGRLF